MPNMRNQLANYEIFRENLLNKVIQNRSKKVIEFESVSWISGEKLEKKLIDLSKSTNIV